MNKNMHGLLVLASLLVYTIRGTIPGLEIPVNYIVWFQIMYVIGAYLRIYFDELPDILINPRKNGIVMMGMIVLAVASIIGGVYYTVNTGVARYYYYVADSNKLMAVLLAVTSFCFFKTHHIKYNKLINGLGSATFGVLLIHANSDAMRKWLWGTINPVQMFETRKIYFLSFAVVVGIFVICSIIDKIRVVLLETPIFHLLGNKIDVLDDKINSLCE